MKTHKAILGMLLVGAVLLQGCVIGFPPLVNVESKDNNKKENTEVMKRLESIDKRLSQLEAEQKAAQK
jgi:PBP1b-binding outer membrane lipoprotein LpoB